MVDALIKDIKLFGMKNILDAMKSTNFLNFYMELLINYKYNRVSCLII
jgi:hypothetical protein